MITQVRKPAKIVVVDPQPNDYDAILRNQSLSRIDFQFHGNGRSLLRDQTTEHPDLCVINVNLPDMSGIDVFKMVDQRWPGVPVYLVGDDYRPEDEIKARISGAMCYFCKPLQGAWLVEAAAAVG